MGRRVALASASLAVHVAMFLVVAALPDPPRPRVHPPPPTYTPVDLVEMDRAAPSMPARPREAHVVGSSDPRPEPEVIARRTPPRRRPSRGRAPSRASTSQGGVAPEPPAPEVPQRSATVVPLPLSGLRTPPAGTLAPRLPRAGSAPGRRTPDTGRRRTGLPTDDAVIETPADAGFVLQPDGRWIFRDPDPAARWSAELLPDGRLRFDDHLAPKVTDEGIVVPGLKELVPAAAGFEFWQRRKRRLIRTTKAMRLKMAVAFAEENIDRQLRRLERELFEIWMSDRPPHTRRALVFELWDDCEEHLTVELGDFEHERSKVDALREAAGNKARATIIAFIRRQIPQGSVHAYSPTELQALNRHRLSEESFDPYAG